MALQKPLRGFSNFIGLFRGGNFQLDPVPTLQPVIEMEDWIGPNPFVLFQGTIASLGDEVLVEVPGNEFWRVKWVGSYYKPNAGIKIITRWLYRPIEGTGSIDKIYMDLPFGDAIGGDGAVGVETGRGMDMRGFNLRPGDKFGIEASSKSGAGSFSLNVFIQYQKILV